MIVNNIKCECKQIVKSILLLGLGLLIIAVGSVFTTGIMERLIEIGKEQPKEILALCGVSHVYAKRPELLFFYVIIIIFNMVAICLCASSVAEAIRGEEESGMIQFYINQPYTKTQIFIMKVMIAIVSGILQWICYIGLLMTSVYGICRYLGYNFVSEMEEIAVIGVRGIPFLLCSLALALFYVMFEERSITTGYFLAIIFSVSFMLGNVYKIFDVIVYYLRSLQRDASSIVSIVEILEPFRMLFPFTMLNIFNANLEPLSNSVYIIYSGIALIFFIICWWRYQRKTV
ncbi:MAG: ABC transporter permease subunit [Lachnospiraceae bacterium]|nr:ABC transporter permease subunit [Lachnospiraceae bacterium]